MGGGRGRAGEGKGRRKARWEGDDSVRTQWGQCHEAGDPVLKGSPKNGKVRDSEGGRPPVGREGSGALKGQAGQRADWGEGLGGGRASRLGATQR